MKKTIGFLFLGAILCYSWTFLQDNQIKKAEWLLGTWKNTTSRGILYETWTKNGENEFAGKSYKVKNQDTMVFERIRLVYEENQLYYIPTVGNQNNGEPVRFALKKISEKELVFENPEHDFPQVISYTKIREDSLVAEISGVRNGETKRQTFPMKKVN
ncbi:DUF6265 family protein [Fluviicola sp.]|uniref:DUF6265 family protein n=1 Tax=Fluviicola sp. TaxID=1917219 RepID=UPI0026188137|nr:DUF6265 family protein [Fluviicola sp.]